MFPLSRRDLLRSTLGGFGYLARKEARGPEPEDLLDELHEAPAP